METAWDMHTHPDGSVLLATSHSGAVALERHQLGCSDHQRERCVCSSVCFSGLKLHSVCVHRRRGKMMEVKCDQSTNQVIIGQRFVIITGSVLIVLEQDLTVLMRRSLLRKGGLK